MSHNDRNEKIIDTFKTPKLLIVESVIQEVDIYTEMFYLPYAGLRCFSYPYNEQMYIEWREMEIESNITINRYNDPYSCLYTTYDDSELAFHAKPINRDVIPIENVRLKAIDEINKAMKENLERYDLEKEKYIYNRATLTEKAIEEMERGLFREKFAFVLKIDRIQRGLKQYTIITDFYVDRRDRRLLQDILKYK